MAKIAIYRKNGTLVYQNGFSGHSDYQVYADSLEYVGTDMGERFCTVTVKTPYPVDFATGDYIMYRGEKFSIYDESNVLKCARSGSYGEGFVYDGLKFASRGQELINNEFLDVVLEDNQAHYTNLPEFSFFCETVDDLLDRIQANMDALTGTQNRWKIFSPDKDRSVQRGVTEQEWLQYFPIPQGQSYTPPAYEITRKNVSVSDQNCWGALTLTNSDFKLNFFVVGDSIVVGAERGTLSQNFTYGKGNGLYEIGRNIDDGAAVITRLHAYGTDENIAPRYYNNRSMLPWFNCAYYSSSGVPIYNNFYFFDVSNGYTAYLDKTMFEGVVEAKDTDIANLEIYYDVSETAPIPFIAPIKICLNQEDYINGENIKEAYVGFNIRFYSDYYGEQHGVTRLIGACLIVSQQVYNALSLNTNHKLYIADGANKNDWTAWDMGGGIYVRGFDMLTGNNDNMAIQKLMLPAFPLQTLKDWVLDHLDAGRGDKVNEDGSITWNGYTAFFSEDINNPYIESVNRDALGIRPYSTTFDGNDDKDDIHPTVDKITIGDLLDAGILVPTSYYNASRDKRVDQLVAVGADITDTGIVDENGYTNDKVTNEKKKAEDYFYVYTYQLGFDLETYRRASGADAKISFVDGKLGGYEFPIESVTAQTVSLPVTSGGTTTNVNVVCNKLKCKREKASDINMNLPKYGYNPDVGDKFVLLGINMPRTYVDVASVKLLKAALKYLSENEHSKFLYEPKIDELFMAEQHREATANSDTSLYMTIREGQLFHFTDTDLDVEVSMPINTLTIKEDGNNGTPTFEITVKNDTKATSITRNGSAASGANTSVNVNNTGISQEDVNAIKNWVDQHFLYKDRQDVAQSLINFLEGLQVGDIFNTGPLGVGGVFRKESDGTTYVEADKLYVRMKAYFDSVEIREYKYTGGNRIASVAGNKAIRIEWIRKVNGEETVLEQIPANRSNVDFFRCYFRASDGEDTVMNNFVVGDMVYCHVTSVAGSSDNPEQGGLNQKHYWRLCVGRNEEGTYTEDGEAWIDISNKTVETISSVSYPGYQSGSDIPAEQDSMIQLGNVNDTTRQGAIIEFVTCANAPTYQIFQGIGSDATNPYSLEDKNQIAFGYNSQTGHAYMDVFGDLFVGDRSKQHGYLMFDQQDRILELSGRLSVGSTLADGRDINVLGTAKANLLLNSSFTGDYDSEDVTENTDVTEDTVIYSDPLKHWNASNVTVITSVDSESGYAAKIANDGTLAQDVSLQQGKWYVLSFRGNGGTLDYSVGGSTGTITLKQTIDFYSVPFVCETNSGLSFTATSQVVLMEIQLSEGNVPTAWTQNYTDGNKTMASVNEYKYVSDAIRNGSTDIIGGLILSQLIKVGNYRDKVMTQETGGMSGIFTSNNSPFLWGGGTMSQAIYTIMKYANDPSYQASDEEVANMSNFVVTHGGRAILNDIILRGYVYALGGTFKGYINAEGGTFRGYINAESGNITGAVKIGEDGGRRVLVLDPHSISGQPNSPALYGKIQNETRFALSLLREINSSFSEHANIKMNGYDGNDVITESEFSDDRFHLKYEVNDPEPSLMGKDFTFDIAYDNGIVFTIKKKNFDTAKEDTITIKLPYDGRIEMRFVDGDGGCLIPPSPSGLLVGSIYHDNGTLKVVI